MRTAKPFSPVQFSPIGMRLVATLVSLPLVVPMLAWIWSLASPESLWQFAERVRPFTLAVTSLVAMPKHFDFEAPVHELVYAVLLAGWAIVMLLHAILLVRFRRHIPAWVRSKKVREIERTQTAKPWALPMTYLLGLTILIDILFFGQIYSFACFGIGHRSHHFGTAMFYLGGSLLLIYILGLGILQRIVFRAYRDTSVKQVGTER